MKPLTEMPEWHALKHHYQTLCRTHLASLFKQDIERGSRFSLKAAGIYLDFSKNHITEETIKRLCTLARARDLNKQIEELFAGNLVNFSEDQPALHMAWRSFNPAGPSLSFKTQSDLKKAWFQIEQWVCRIQQGGHQSYAKKAFRDVVNIGIGGSHLGAQAACQALAAYQNSRLNVHFIANLDAIDAQRVLSALNPETTLFLIVSKSFATGETLKNVERAKQWLKNAAPSEANLQPHFIAVTQAVQSAMDYGIASDYIVSLWPEIGGRYSLCSPSGLALALMIGIPQFRQLLAGAHAMDEHFINATFEKNVPMLLGLIGIWYINFFQAQSQAIIPYSQRLRALIGHLKQLHMESLGKSCQRNGMPLDYATGNVIWGDVGSNSQHSFHQLFLQGTVLTPIDFILPINDLAIQSRQYDLIAQCLSQSQILMQGYSRETIQKDLIEQGVLSDTALQLAPHKVISGNRPSNTLLMESINPYTFGALIALYEHKIYVQSAIWNINAFDQWGVERGKLIAQSILDRMAHKKVRESLDSSTEALMSQFAAW